MRDHHGCPVQATINVLSGKWKVQILWHLALGATRFSHLRTRLPGISDKVLAEQLRQLEADGVVARPLAVSPALPATYRLSERGRELVPMMEALCAWGSSHFGITPRFPKLPVPP